MDTSAKNQYIGITNTMQGLKNIYLPTYHKKVNEPRSYER